MKKTYTTLLSALLLSFILTANAQAQSRENWTYDDYWEDTKLSFEILVNGFFNDNNCKDTITKFVACMGVLNDMHDINDPDNLETIVVDLKNDMRFEMVDSETLSVMQSLRDLKEELESSMSEEGTRLLRDSFEFKLAEFKRKSVNNSNDSRMAAELFNTYLQVVQDPHFYITPAKYTQDRSRSEVSSKGLGIYHGAQEVDGAKKIFVIEVIEDSPAERSGLIAGDIFMTLNGIENYQEMLEEMKAKDVLEIDVKRDEDFLTIRLVKGVYTVKNVISKTITRPEGTYGYLKLRSFMDDSGCSKMKSAAKEFKRQSDFKGFILDLRNNGGGKVQQMICMAGIFLEPGSIAWMFKNLNENVMKYTTLPKFSFSSFLQNSHNVVLINGTSASASEALSMYLQDYEKAFILGERSFGKGSMQSVGRADARLLGQAVSGVRVAATAALYYGPKGVSPQVEGVIPDFEVFPRFTQTEPSSFEREEDRYAFPIEDRPVDRAALISKRRIENNRAITKCLNSTSRVESDYTSLSKAQKRLFDNQLQTAVEVVKCANTNVDIVKTINIKQTNDIPMQRARR